MTQDHSALLAQLDALKSADVGAVFAELIRTGLRARNRRPRSTR
jgi:putative transposase